MKRMGAMITAGLIATLIVAPMSFADGVMIPGSIKVGQFKKLMKDRGMNLYCGDESDGAVEEGGTQIKVVTYQPVTEKQLDDMKEAALLSLRGVK